MLPAPLGRRAGPAAVAAAWAPFRCHGAAGVCGTSPGTALRQGKLGCGQARWQAARVTVSRGRLEEFIRAELSYFAQQLPQPLKLDEIVHASTPGKVARLVHKELPYRFAARIKHVESLEGWAEQPELVKLRDIFLDSFKELRLTEPPAVKKPRVSDLADFTDAIYMIRRRHRPVVALLAEAMRKMHREASEDFAEAFQSWADTFLLSRISTEMLTSHYVAIIEASSQEPAAALETGSVGIVDTKCNPGQICEQAAKAVRESVVMRGQPGVGVRIDVQTNNCSSSQAMIEFSYIPRYLFYIVQELLRNSARATLDAAEASGDPGDVAKRPITVTVCADRKKVAIRISDNGGGVSFGNADQIWSYTFSTSRQAYEDYADRESPLSGWAMGLPASRLYASYLGGKLDLMNMPGIGVDAYLFLNRITPEENMGELRSSLGSLSEPI